MQIATGVALKIIDMKDERTNTEKLIEYLEAKNFQFSVDYNPSEAKIALINAKIAKNKKIRGDHG